MTFQADKLVSATLTPATMGVSFTSRRCDCMFSPEERREAAQARANGEQVYCCRTCLDTQQTSDYKWAKHVLEMDKKLVQLAQRKIKRLMLLMPPRHGKSELASYWFPIWYKTRFPSHNIALTSYGGKFSEGWGSRVRDFYYTFGKDLNQTVVGGGPSQWSTSTGGRMDSVGIGGSLTGLGFNLGIIDDPIKNHKEALSTTTRQNHKDWYQTTFRTRLELDGNGLEPVLLVLMTHWHPDDLSGFIREAEQDEYDWHLVKFPALDEQGQALWPERWSVENLEKLRDSMDPIWWELLYQQNDPLNVGTSHWPLKYFENVYCKLVPETSKVWPSIVVLDSAEGKGDWSAYSYTKLIRNTFFTDMRAERIPPEIAIDKTVLLAKEYKCKTIAVEAQTFSSLVAGEINRALKRNDWTDGVKVMVLQNYEEKNTRIMNLGTYWSRNRLKVVNNLGGRELIKEAKEWPNTDYDDCLDNIEMAIRHMPIEGDRPPHTPDDFIRSM